VLYWQCDIHYKEVMRVYLERIPAREDPYDFLRYFFGYWMKAENRRILEQLINIGHFDIIFNAAMKVR